jgi:hypothetical protein
MSMQFSITSDYQPNLREREIIVLAIGFGGEGKLVSLQINLFFHLLKARPISYTK